MSQKQYKAEASHKVRAKLAQIREQEKEIGTLIQSIVTNAELTAESLLTSTGGKSRFLSRYKGVQQELEEVANKLFITKTSLLDEADSDDDSQSEAPDQTTVVPSSLTSAFDISEVIETPLTPPMHSTCLEEPKLPSLTEDTEVEFHLPEEISKKVDDVIEKACRQKSPKKKRRVRERASLPPLKLNTGKPTDVYVTEVFSPSLFWVQVKSAALDDLMRDLQAVESQHALSITDIEWGMLVRARFIEDRLWYRAYVTGLNSASIDVIYADYGNSCRLELKDIQRMPSQFTKLPASALCCSLAQVWSMELDLSWPQDTINLFAVHLQPSNNYLVQITPSFEAGCPLLFVDVNLPNDSQTVNKMLINDAHARPVPNNVIAECYRKQQQGGGEFVLSPELHAIFLPKARTTRDSAQLEEDLTDGTSGKDESPTPQAVTPEVLNVTPEVAIVTPEVATVTPEVATVTPEVTTVTLEVPIVTPEVATVTPEVPILTPEVQPVKVEEAIQSIVSKPEVESAEPTSSVVSEERSMRSDKPQLHTINKQPKKREETKSAASSRFGPNQRRRQRSRRTSDQSEVSSSYSKAVSDDVARLQKTASPPVKPKQPADSGVMDDFDDFVVNDDILKDLDDEIERQSANVSRKEEKPQRNQHGLPLMEVNIPGDSCVNFLMSHIVSPSKFWVHLVRKDCQVLDDLMEELNSCYRASEKEVMRRFFQEHQRNIGDFCCAQFSQDGRYYRAQVMEFRVNEITELLSKIQVAYIDYGNTEWLPPAKVFPLQPRFLQHPAMALACRAVDVQPLGQGSDRKDPRKWSKKAIEEFINLTGFHHDLTGFVVELQPSTSVNLGLNDVLDLLVIDSADEQEFSVGDKLKEKGLAQTLSPFACVSDINPEASEDDDFGDPMAEEYLSIRNSYAVDPDDPGVATMGYSANDEKNVCHFFKLKGRCNRGELCPFLHDIPKGAITSTKAEVFGVNDSVQVIEIPRAGSFVTIEITAIFMPNRFYALFPYGPTPILDVLQKAAFDEGVGDDYLFDEGSLEALNGSMDMHYGRSSSHTRDLFVLAQGEIVAAQYEDGKWYRAKVIEAEPEEDKQRVKIFFVDYGNSAWVKECYIRQMIPRFMHLPFQAVECFLPIEPTEGKWSAEAKERFSELAEGRLVIAEIIGGAYGTMTCEIFDASPESKLPNQDSVSINQVLINEGHARKVERSLLKRTSSNASSSSSIVYIPG